MHKLSSIYMKDFKKQVILLSDEDGEFHMLVNAVNP